MKEVKCPCCGKNILDVKKLKDDDRILNYAGWGALIVCSNPLFMGAGALAVGCKAVKKHYRKEVDVKCPHCKKVITLDKKQYKEIAQYLRHKGQNRVD